MRENSFESEGMTLLRYNGYDEYVFLPEQFIAISGRRMGKVRYQSYADSYAPEVIPGAFEGLSKIRGIHLPSGLREIGSYAFAGCSQLKALYIGPQCISLGEGAFFGSGVRRMVIPEGITHLEKDLFRDATELLQISLPRSLISIGDNAFRGCKSLQRIVLPPNVVSIGSGAFSFCSSFSFLRVPDSVREVGKGAFLNCSSLRNVDAPRSMPEVFLQGSSWYAERQMKKNRCPVCGSLCSGSSGICIDPLCSTNFGTWER